MASLHDYMPDIRGWLDGIAKYDPENGLSEAAQLLRQLWLSKKKVYDWLTLDQLRSFVAKLDQPVAEQVIIGLWGWLSAYIAIDSRNRQTEGRIRPGDQSVALEDRLLGREALRILAEGFREGQPWVSVPDDEAQEALLRDWLTTL